MKPLGILGGGQLARMMAFEAHAMGIPVAILSEDESDPAAQVTSLWTKGKLDDRKDLARFLENCSLVTFESEFLDAGLLEEISVETRTPVLPKPQHMAALQDRLSQKRLLEKHKLPTSPFMQIKSAQEARDAFRKFKGELVFKKRRFGYDGYGTFVVRSEKDLESFLERLEQESVGFIAEKFIPFKREIAVMVARSKNGRTLHLPFVETLQENSRCLWVKGPLRETTSFKTLARKLEKFLESVGYVGIMGIELFDTGKGFLINELAPRVHNSGHYSQNALSDNQFSLHVKAVMGIEIGGPELLTKGFAMWNLLGSSEREPSWRLPADVKLHWYGKKKNRAGRKMGHINVLGSSPEDALRKAKRARAEFDV